MFPTDQARFDAFLTNVGNEVSRTSQFLANYIPSKLNMSGAAERLIIADTIKQFPGTGDIPHTQFNTLVNLLYESLKHTGHKRKKYYLALKELLGQFKSNNISLVDQYLTKTASIVRHKTFCSVACTYFARTKSYQREESELPFLDYFDYNNNPDRGWFDDNTCYQIYFFL
uniref:Uncharacterized protein n=1 Tax=Meloidogyne incognita TaxID=6306 RepID=A0A914MZK8_MELIC